MLNLNTNLTADKCTSFNNIIYFWPKVCNKLDIKIIYNL